MMSLLTRYTPALFLCCLAVQLYQPVEGSRALIIVDVQNCFLPNGTLAVNDSDQVIDVINNIRRYHDDYFTVHVITQDWHCPNHISFSSSFSRAYQTYDGRNYVTAPLNLTYYSKNGKLCRPVSLRRKIKMQELMNCEEDVDWQNTNESFKSVYQEFWPDHCVKNSTDAEVSDSLEVKDTDIVIRKGQKCHIDSYSAFFDNGGFSSTDLDNQLKKNEIKSVYLTGIATDYCVRYTALDAAKLGYKTTVILDATKGISQATTDEAIADMKSKGIRVITSKELINEINAAPVSHFSTSLMLLISAIFTYNLACS